MDQNQYNNQPVQKKSSGGKFLFFIFIVGVLFLIIFLIIPNLNTNKIRGNIRDVLIIPDSNKLWIASDGSFSFWYTEVTRNSKVSKKINFSKKSMLYIYDPYTKKIVTALTKKSSLSDSVNLYFINNKVLQICSSGSSGDPAIYYYNPQSGYEIMNTQSFIAKYSELKTGISEISITNAPVSIDIKTKDGLEFIYFIKKEVLFDKQNLKFYPEKAFLLKSYPDIKKCFVFNAESSSPRKKLYLLRGSEMILMPYKKIDSYIDDNKIKSLQTDEMDQIKRLIDEGLLNNFDNEISIAPPELISADKIYLEGLIFYQDNEIAMILHQNQVGKNADRYITCVDVTGKQRWTISAPKIFKEMRMSADNPFYDNFFIKSVISGDRSGNLFILKLRNVGFASIDMENGDILWKKKWQ